MIISEIFLSIQGESTYVGIPCGFIRLAGCNLSCDWCDTTYARTTAEGKEMTVDDIVSEIKKFNVWLVEITGGEPLIQEETSMLAGKLLDAGFKVLLETNGSVDFSDLDRQVVKIVDVKCPSSRQEGVIKLDNLECLTSEDEVKFVIRDREDYEFAKQFIFEYLEGRTTKLLFAPVRPDLEPSELADWILKDGLRVRLQVQIHRYIWTEERK